MKNKKIAKMRLAAGVLNRGLLCCCCCCPVTWCFVVRFATTSSGFFYQTLIGRWGWTGLLEIMKWKKQRKKIMNKNNNVSFGKRNVNIQWFGFFSFALATAIKNGFSFFSLALSPLVTIKILLEAFHLWWNLINLITNFRFMIKLIDKTGDHSLHMHRKLLLHAF